MEGVNLDRPDRLGPSAGYWLAKPPRSVPLSVRLPLLLGGLGQIGWLVLAMGMVFFWIFALNADVARWFVFSGPLDRAEGQVTASRETSASEDDVSVYANHYRFSYRGRAYEGVSYATGKKLKPGSRVTIEMPRGDPTWSRIQGMRTTLFGPLAAIVVVFPLAGLGMVLARLYKGARPIRLLKHGLPTWGKLVSKTPTSVRVNQRPVYKLTFEFTTEDGRTCRATSMTPEPEALEDEAEEPLVYDPLRPSRATTLDQLPGAPVFDQMGFVRSRRPGQSLLVCLLPAVCLIGHGLYAWFRFQG